MRICCTLFFLATSLWAQANIQRLVFVTSNPAGVCTTAQAMRFNTSTGDLYGCVLGTWAKVAGSAGGGAAGSSGQIQYNNGGVLGGATATSWDDTNRRLTIGTAGLPASNNAWRVQVASEGFGGDIELRDATDDDGFSSVNLLASNGTTSSPTIVGNQQILGGLYWQGYDGVQYLNTAVMYGATTANGSISAGDVPGRILIELLRSNALLPILTLDTTTTSVGIASLGGAIVSTGTSPGAAPVATGCTAAAIVAGSTLLAGQINGTPTGACVLTLTFPITAAHGWNCAISNQTTANLIRQSASTGTTAVFTGTTVANDVLAYGPCVGW